MVRKKMMWLTVAAVVILSAEYGFGQIIPAAEAAAGRALAASQRGNKMETLNEMNEAIRIDPSGEGGKYYILRAAAYCDLGLYELGFNDLRTFERIGNVYHPDARAYYTTVLNGCKMKANPNPAGGGGGYVAPPVQQVNPRSQCGGCCGTGRLGGCRGQYGGTCSTCYGKGWY